MYKLLASIFLLFFTVLMTSCSRVSSKDTATVVNNINVTIPDLEQTYKLVYISDLHIIDDITEVDEEHRGTVQSRKSSMINPKGETAKDYWPTLISEINSHSPDAVLLGGDMIDYMSPSNVACLNEGLKKLSAPVIYVRADHDYANWFDKDITPEAIHSLGQSIDSNAEIMIYSLKEFTILGINNSTSQISPSALTKLNEFFDTNQKPVILLTHVPFASPLNPTLDAKSKEVWQDRSLIWGNDCYYVPDSNTKQAIESIFNPTHNVKAVLTGHLHFSHTGQLTEDITQYLFEPAYLGKMTVITISNDHKDDTASVPHFPVCSNEEYKESAI